MSLQGYFKEFFEEEKGNELENLADNVDTIREIHCRHGELVTYHEMWEENLGIDPLNAYWELYMSLNDALDNSEYRDFFPRINGRFGPFVKISDAIMNKRRKYFSAEVTIMSKSDNHYGIVSKVFTCKSCGTKNATPFKKVPDMCPNCEMWWKKEGKDYSLSEEVRVPETHVQIGETKEDGTMLMANAFIYGLNAATLKLGQRVEVNLIKNIQKEKGNYTNVFMIVGWEDKDHTWGSIKIPDHYMDMFKAIEDNWDHFHDLKRCYAPSIIGYEDIKESLLIQCVMDGFEDEVGGTRNREWVSVMLAGDPGTAKTKLCEYTSKIHPKVARGGGSRSTKAGLTVAIVPDPLDPKKRIARVGTLVMANNGLAIIDEFDKMSNEDKKSIQSAMEEGMIEVAMADVHSKFTTETPILASCNPKKAFFDRTGLYEPLEELDVSWEILSRFDFIWVLVDYDHEERDREISVSIRGGMDKTEFEYDAQYIQYYLAYIRQTKTVMTDKVGKLIDDWYVDQRKKMKDERKINPRVNVTLNRLCKALAKFRRYKNPVSGEYEVTEYDFEEAKRLYHAMLSSQGPTTGFGDINRMYRGHSLRRDNIHARIEEYVGKYEPTDDDLHDHLIDLDKRTVDREIERLNNEGRITKDRDGVWRCI